MPRRNYTSDSLRIQCNGSGHPILGGDNGVRLTVTVTASPLLLCGQSWTCADCDKILGNDCSSRTTACEGGSYLLPFGVPGPPSLAVDASSTRFNGVRPESFNCGQSRRFAAASTRGHRVDLQRVSDPPPQSGGAGDRISSVAHCGLDIPPASFLPG
jgi:hypothetical protein